MKKLKCIKCGLYFKDRNDDKDSPTDKTLCFNCCLIWRTLGLFIRAYPPKLNRYVTLKLDDLVIRKLK